MALVPHTSSSGKDENRGAIVAVRGAQELTQEEYEQRIKDVCLLKQLLSLTFGMQPFWYCLQQADLQNAAG